MAVILQDSTKILELAKEYPFLFDTLIKISPKLRRLKNPILQRTVGRRATLTDVSKMANIPLRRLFDVLAESIMENTEETVEIDRDDKAKSEWYDELENRREKMKDIIMGVHKGEEMEKLQAEFKKVLKDVSASEIADMEQSLITSGDLTAEEVTALCDIHVQVFKESLDIHQKPETTPGHPIHTYMKENAKARELIAYINDNPRDKEVIEELKQITLHYQRLQNQLFPLLEKAGITGPSTVMWAKQDEIRDMLKGVDETNLSDALTAVEDMIFKETNILYPMALENLSEYDWVKVRLGEEEIGYAWITPGDEWKPITPIDIHEADQEPEAPEINLNTGKLTLEEIDLILRHLPIDISFVGVDETVKYYSATDDRIFPRSPGVIGRSVINCHPRKSFDKVQQILTNFREGKKDKAVFWIQMSDRFLLISYYAVHNGNGEFMGTLEVSQDVTKIRSLEGEKRLLDWHQES